MTLSIRASAAASGLAVVGAVAVLSAAKPAPAPVSTPANVTFRCMPGGPYPALGPCADPVLAPSDRARDDGQAYSTGTIGSNGMYLVRLMPAAGRWMSLYLYQQFMVADSRTCAGNCNADGPLYNATQPLTLQDVELRTKPLLTTGDDLPGGLFAMNCGGTSYPGMVHFTFWLPSGNGHWGLNFNPRSAAGSSPVVITRTSLTHWTVEAPLPTEASPLADVGGLLSWGHSRLRGNSGPSVEGAFHVPFLFTIDATGTPPAVSGCS